jgi:hypothetical protein
MTVAQMAAHIASLCVANEISKRKGSGFAFYWLREIIVPPIKSVKSYATALHEIGHILGRHQLSEVILVRERWAWEWARRNAHSWTPAMERYSEWCLEYYERTPYARRSNGYEIVSET